MYFNHAGLLELISHVRKDGWSCMIENGNIFTMHEDESDVMISFAQDYSQDNVWSLSAQMEDASFVDGGLLLESYYGYDQVGFVFRMLCDCAEDRNWLKFQKMVRAHGVNIKQKSWVEDDEVHRLCDMLYIKGMNVSWLGGKFDNVAVVNLENSKRTSHMRSYQFKANWPEIGCASVYVYDSHGNNLNEIVFPWMYGSMDVVAAAQAIIPLMCTFDPWVSDHYAK